MHQSGRIMCGFLILVFYSEQYFSFVIIIKKKFGQIKWVDLGDSTLFI